MQVCNTLESASHTSWYVRPWALLGHTFACFIHVQFEISTAKRKKEKILPSLVLFDTFFRKKYHVYLFWKKSMTVYLFRKKYDGIPFLKKSMTVYLSI